MNLCRYHFRFNKFLIAIVALTIASWTSTAAAQADGDGDDDPNPIAGIDVDAKGVLKIRQLDPRLNQQRRAAARAINADVMRPSELRKVSLNRLEAAIKKRRESGQPLSDEMKALAGLTAVQYVFFYPETLSLIHI